MERWAPAALAYDWDRIGLGLGRPDAEVSRVLTCLSLTRASVAAAKKQKAGLIVSHHPLIWDPIRSLRTDNPQHALILELAAANIHCFAAHTNLDIAPDGVNDLLAEAVGLEEVRGLFPVKQAGQVKLVCFVPEAYLAAVREAAAQAGAGEIGAYTHCTFSTPGVGTFKPGTGAAPFSGVRGALSQEPEMRFEVLVAKARLPQVLSAVIAAHPYEEVAYDVVSLENKDHRLALGRIGNLPRATALDALGRDVMQALGLQHVRVSGELRRKVRTVAVMGGAGGSQIPEIPVGIDVFITGDVKYHDAQTAIDRGLAVIDAGHWGTEKAIAPAMAEYLRRACKGLKVNAYLEDDPFHAMTL